jgi:hypothetical protein
MHITVSALSFLTQMMEDMQVRSIPIWFCPTHPDKEIRITEHENEDGTRNLKARCAFFSNDGGTREWCVSEYLGPDGAVWKPTGAPIWKALDLIYQAGK